MRGDGAQQPAGIYGDHNDEQVDREQQVDGLQHLHHPPRRAPVEVIDVDDDPVDARAARPRRRLHRPAGRRAVRCGGHAAGPGWLGRSLGEPGAAMWAKSCADLGHHAKPAAVVAAGVAVGDHSRQLPRGGEVLHLPFQRRDLGRGHVGRGLQPLPLRLAHPHRGLPRRARLAWPRGPDPARTVSAAASSATMPAAPQALPQRGTASPPRPPPPTTTATDRRRAGASSRRAEGPRASRQEPTAGLVQRRCRPHGLPVNSSGLVPGQRGQLCFCSGGSGFPRTEVVALGLPQRHCSSSRRLPGGLQPLPQAPLGDQFGGQPGLLPLLRARVAVRRRRQAGANNSVDQAGPQVGFGVMPGVEPHLPHRGMCQRIIRAGSRSRPAAASNSRKWLLPSPSRRTAPPPAAVGPTSR